MHASDCPPPIVLVLYSSFKSRSVAGPRSTVWRAIGIASRRFNVLGVCQRVGWQGQSATVRRSTYQRSRSGIPLKGTAIGYFNSHFHCWGEIAVLGTAV